MTPFRVALGGVITVRFLSLTVLAAWLCLASSVYADGSDGGSSDQSTPAAPSGPVLQPADNNPVVCDGSSPGFHYLEVKGSGFEPWATQQLVGHVVDAAGAPKINWPNVWVSPQGQLTLEVNLCADPFAKRAALAPGNYTVSVGTGNSTIASTGIALSPAAAPGTDAAPAPAVPIAQPMPAAGANGGYGTLQQPIPIGVQGALVDGWNIGVTGANPDAFSTIKSAVLSAVQPPADQRDIMLRVQSTYTGPGTSLFSNSRLALYSTATHQTYDQVHNSCGIVPDPVQPNLVVSGTVQLGNVCFTVPASEVGSLLLFDNQSTPSNQVYLALPL
jgi:hypothetical protein